MNLVIDEGKTAQAAAHLILLQGGRMNYTALIKLLYLADRQALTESGYPITGDRMVSMPHGPVLSGVYDHIKEPARDGHPWHEWITRVGSYDVAVRDDPPDDRLSRFELATLQSVHDTYGERPWWELRELTHELPEWEDPQGSSLPIRPERILEAEGKKASEIERARADAERVAHARELLQA